MDDVRSFASSSLDSLGEDSYGDLTTLIPVGSIPYRRSRVTIFKKPGRVSDLFYYEPIVVLDPQSIQTVEYLKNGILQLEVSFTIELWNTALEKEIVKFLQREFEGLKRFQLQVMPYDEFRLVKMDIDRERIAFMLPDSPKSFVRLQQSLDFVVWCASSDKPALMIDPERVLAHHLALEFKIPSSAGQANLGIGGGRRLNRFDFNIVRKSDDQIIPLQGKFILSL